MIVASIVSSVATVNYKKIKPTWLWSLWPLVGGVLPPVLLKSFPAYLAVFAGSSQVHGANLSDVGTNFHLQTFKMYL